MDPASDLGSHVGIGGGRHHDELVAGEPSHRVGGAHHAAQPAGQLRQHGVAGRMAVEVVHGLEAVDVDEQHGERRAGATARRQALRRAVVDEEAVGQAGEGRA